MHMKCIKDIITEKITNTGQTLKKLLIDHIWQKGILIYCNTKEL